MHRLQTPALAPVCALILTGCPATPLVDGRLYQTQHDRLETYQSSREISLEHSGGLILTRPDQETVITVTVVPNAPIFVADDLFFADESDVRVRIARRNGHQDDEFVFLDEVLLEQRSGGRYVAEWRGEVPELIPGSGQLSPATWSAYVSKFPTDDEIAADITVEFSYIPW